MLLELDVEDEDFLDALADKLLHVAKVSIHGRLKRGQRLHRTFLFVGLKLETGLLLSLLILMIYR